MSLKYVRSQVIYRDRVYVWDLSEASFKCGGGVPTITMTGQPCSDPVKLWWIETYFMALYILSLGSQDAVCEVLLGKEPCEDSQHVVLVIVPFQAVLLKLPRTHLLFSIIFPIFPDFFYGIFSENVKIFWINVTTYYSWVPRSNSDNFFVRNFHLE